MTAASHKKATFNAPYDEVFRAVTVALSSERLVTKDFDLRLNIESSDKAAGVILATPINGEHCYFAIIVSKIKANITEVQIVLKVQDTCISFFNTCRGPCGDLKPRWPDRENLYTPMIFTEIRNLLYKGGAI